MQSDITQPAFQWFKKELRLKTGDTVRFFVRLGGHSTIQQSFSIGVTKEPALDIGMSVEINDILFFVKKEDMWYFIDNDLKVKYNRDYETIEYV